MTAFCPSCPSQNVNFRGGRGDRRQAIKKFLVSLALAILSPKPSLQISFPRPSIAHVQKLKFIPHFDLYKGHDCYCFSHNCICVVHSLRRNNMFLLARKLLELATRNIYRHVALESLCIGAGNDVTSYFRSVANCVNNAFGAN